MTTTPTITLTRDMFNRVLAELALRGGNRRESGAFLLASSTDGHETEPPTRIVAAAYYDDLDPTCLTGGITFTASGYTALNAVCRHQRLRVAADVHTHPGEWVAQSSTDSAHPMVALPGHIAIIVPSYAAGTISSEQLGVHILGADNGWTSYFNADVASIVRIEPTKRVTWLRALVRRLGQLGRILTRRHQ